MKAKLSLIVATILVAASLAGCGATANEKVQMEANYVASVKEAPVEASPDKAVAAVLKGVEDKQGSCSAKELTDAEFEKATGVTGGEYMEVIAYNSSAKEGLADVFVVKPYPSLREDVRSKLLNYRESRLREFENFDILDSYSIAKGAVIYDQGEYLVLLMLKDNDTAQTSIDAYIPQ